MFFFSYAQNEKCTDVLVKKKYEKQIVFTYIHVQYVTLKTNIRKVWSKYSTVNAMILYDE